MNGMQATEDLLIPSKCNTDKIKVIWRKLQKMD